MGGREATCRSEELEPAFAGTNQVLGTSTPAKGDTHGGIPASPDPAAANATTSEAKLAAQEPPGDTRPHFQTMAVSLPGT